MKAAAEYRMLTEGEIIQEDDCFLDDAGVWRKTILAGQPAPNPAFTAHRQYRRYTPTLASGGHKYESANL